MALGIIIRSPYTPYSIYLRGTIDSGSRMPLLANGLELQTARAYRYRILCLSDAFDKLLDSSNNWR